MSGGNCGTIIENLSGRKLGALVACLTACLAVCFLIGGLVAPVPASSQSILATACIAATSPTNNDTWYYTRGRGACESVRLQEARSAVAFAFQMPQPRENVVLDFSRWQQNLIGVLHFDVRRAINDPTSKRTAISIDARLAYRNRGDPDDAWKPYASSVERRTLDCAEECAPVPLFELGSLHHDFYLLNVRLLPVADKEESPRDTLNDVWLIAINQNGGFTKVWLALKTVFFPVIVAILVWFRRRLAALRREPVVLERMLTYVGCALCVLDLPLEYLTLRFDMPFMLLLGDVRQGVFYAALLSFWLVFAGEHMLVRDPSESGSFLKYRAHLSAVATGCASLFAFDICERGAQLRNPFYSIWATDLGADLALAFIISAAISAAVYFAVLCATTWKVFRDISHKRSSLSAMHSARRLHYEGIIYRFKFMMLATVICAALTIIGFALGQMAEGQWRWEDNIEIEYTSAFFTGVYGMWNVYIFALIVLYAPSHKRWPAAAAEDADVWSLGEEIEFHRLPSETSPSEISSLTSFIRKATVD